MTYQAPPLGTQNLVSPAQRSRSGYAIPTGVTSIGTFANTNTAQNLARQGVSRPHEDSRANTMQSFQQRLQAAQASNRRITDYTQKAHQPRIVETTVESPQRFSGPQGFGGHYSSPIPQSFSVPQGNDTGSQIVRAAMDMLGTPYAWGGGGIGVRASRGTGKGTQNVIGVDCSGLTSYVFGKFGIRLPRYSNAQTQVGYKVSINNARPGDIVGWSKGGHVAIYAGNGHIIESPRPGKAVRVRKLHSGESVFAVRIIRN